MEVTYEADKLEFLLQQQAYLQMKMGYWFDAMTEEQRTAYIKEYAMHLEHEMHEMLQELPYFKPWKKYDTAAPIVEANLKAAREEWADVLHHFLNITLALGMNADDLCKLYEDKQKVNYARQADTANYKPCVGGD